MRLIVLSPHADDAALSAGGLIHQTARAGNPVEIWTMMVGFPPDEELSDFAREMHIKWGTLGAHQTVEVRRGEDSGAAALLGATAVHFDFLDAIYRRGPDGAALYTDPIGVKPRAEDASLPRQIRDQIQSRLRPDDWLICQLAIGDHIDHVIVRQAAEMLNRPLQYVADIPYVLWKSEDIAVSTRGLQAVVQPMSEQDVSAWLDAVAVYRSQLSSLYESWPLLQRDIRAHCEMDGGIKVWAPEPRGGPSARRTLSGAPTTL